MNPAQCITSGGPSLVLADVPISLLGWAAAGILVLTIGWQSYQQWRDRNSGGVSLWLFVGQVAANILFAVYAYLTGDAVFLVANLLLLVASGFGLAVKLAHRADPSAVS